VSVYQVEVRGKERTWCINTDISAETAQAWRDDGLTVNKLENTIPAWLPAFVPVGLWCFVQDVFNFRNPWR
jgi:hypothetical protein